jgi:hypothetical protein
MKEIEFIAHGSALHRDGLPTHAMLLDGVRALCGARGVSFTQFDRYKRDADGLFYVAGHFGLSESTNPITCKKCQERLFPVPDEFRKPIPIEVGEWRYMGHWIQDQREYPNLPPFISFPDDESEEIEAHWGSFAEVKRYCKANRNDSPKSKPSDWLAIE